MCERLLREENEKEERKRSPFSVSSSSAIANPWGNAICMLYCSETSGFRQESTSNSADKPQLGHVQMKDMEHGRLVASWERLVYSVAVAKRKKTGSTNPYLLIPNWSHWGQMAWGHVLPCSAFAFPEAQLLFESQLWLPVLHVQRCHFSKLKQEQLFSSAAGIQLQKFLAVLVFSSQMTQKHGRVLTHPMWVCLTGQQGLEAAGGAHAWSSTCLLLCKIQPKKAFKL